MADFIGKILAFVALLAFLGVLMWHVPMIDLGAVVVITLALVAWDFFAPRDRT
ncbi:hypothetical protein [uncultured Paracoccus sp.]|uniref:hypothetical protein n=1 Tax=uncultured Paracoccus sp. TaxID=189685 RepID=UPI002625FE8C|nr:hypothetical protein [uncultured Paracoccus sp.]